jgi:hypothetical protein
MSINVLHDQGALKGSQQFRGHSGAALRHAPFLFLERLSIGADKLTQGLEQKLQYLHTPVHIYHNMPMHGLHRFNFRHQKEALYDCLPVNKVLPHARSSPDMECWVMDRQSTGDTMQSWYTKSKLPDLESDRTKSLQGTVVAPSLSRLPLLPVRFTFPELCSEAQ